MKRKTIIYFFLFSLLFGYIFLATSCSSFKFGSQETVKPAENVEEASKDAAEININISMKEAAELVLSEAKKWKADAEIIEIENIYNMNHEGLSASWLITVVSRSTPPAQEGYGEEFFTGRKYAIEEGRVSLDSDDSIIETFGLLDIKDVMDSPEAVRIAIENGAPEKWESFALYLGNGEDFKEYGEIVLNVFTTLIEEGKLEVKGAVFNPVSGEILKVR